MTIPLVLPLAPSQLRPPDGLLARIGLRAGLAPVAATTLDAVHSGDEHSARLLYEIHSARSSVEIEMYQIRPDQVGETVVTALAAAADRGVRVRLLVDSFGSLRSAGLLRELESTSAEVRWYNPFLPGRRTHRKLVLVDRRRAALGGMNCGAEFSETISGRSCWRDLMLWMEGPAVDLLRSQFEAAWDGHGADPARETWNRLMPGENGIPCLLAGGRDGRTGFLETYEALLDCAREEVLIANPYIVPPRRIFNALCEAARRGVRVVLVIPSRSDVPLFKHGARGLYGRLLAAGVEVWERHDRMVHAKVAVADGEVAAVGSVNLNPRSLTSNAETLLLTSHQPIVSAVRSLVLEEAARASEELSGLTWPRHPGRRPLAEALALPLASIV